MLWKWPFLAVSPLEIMIFFLGRDARRRKDRQDLLGAAISLCCTLFNSAQHI